MQKQSVVVFAVAGKESITLTSTVTLPSNGEFVARMTSNIIVTINQWVDLRLHVDNDLTTSEHC